ncbi:Uncharacterised protein [Legionella steigerwaltii]|uniref:Uncharacterized protein n=1 Tax=Legionella steigerwaltii TaxID=460 RepID=A0A378LCG3_9GAMM|nr:hypothetical protein [Legionella steigerwaltii]KTD71520.1 hypothetical protein Lstg_2929 [Legionella steigerwaltii]STY23548.1 Uncharacterised protein [Legionella steigerwaltii]
MPGHADHSYSVEEKVKLANDYAQCMIQHSSTRLESNSLHEDQTDSLDYFIEHLRELIGDKDKFDTLIEPQFIYEYENNISLTAIFRRGNCFELALQALDWFILYDQDKVLAEIYDISEIDDEDNNHVVLVVNRNPDSNPNDPNTWDENTWICDPWAKSNFRATDFRKKLQNFYVNNDTNENCVRDIDLDRDKIRRDRSYNAATLRLHRSTSMLYRRFKIAFHTLLRTFEEYIHEQLKHLSVTHSDYTVLNDKLDAMEELAEQGHAYVNQVSARYKANDSYREARHEFLNALRLYMHKIDLAKSNYEQLIDHENHIAHLTIEEDDSNDTAVKQTGNNSHRPRLWQPPPLLKDYEEKSDSIKLTP